MDESVWIMTPPQREARRLAVELGLPPEIAQVLVNRNIHHPQEAQKFLFGKLDHLHDPYLMTGMEKSVERLRRAISRKEKVLIFGDYDVDGVLSVVVLTKALSSLGLEVDYYIPNRLEEGYGIKEEYIDIAVKKKADLVMSVDCGIKANAFVDRATREKIDVIITDHHLPGRDLPAALAILNPALPGSAYPDRRLAGIGVVFKLIQALFGGQKKLSSLPHYLKMVSIGTIADIAELRGENRLFVRYGLKGLEEVSNQGLLNLLGICGLGGKEISVGDVGFRIGPRINAAGRMGLADLAVELFLSPSPRKTQEIVCRLDSLNSKRQRIEEKIYNQVLDLIKGRSLDQRYRILIMGCEEWHRGVIGIVASRIKDLYHRPVLLFSYEDRRAYGSGRSISEFSLIDCLEENRDYCLNYGGHRLAAGCELEREKMGFLKKGLNEWAHSRLKEEHLRRKIYIDAKIEFTDIDYSFVEKHSLLSPFGVGNPKPLFLTQKVEVVSRPKRMKGRHCKFLVKQNGRVLEALGWRRGEWTDIIYQGMMLDVVYSFHFSQYLGEEKLSLAVEDIKI
ncbi:MAG: single-stranded-DNA-specific exonuclease RecJ [Candidatus Aminicenantes bacterium]